MSQSESTIHPIEMPLPIGRGFSCGTFAAPERLSDESLRAEPGHLFPRLCVALHRWRAGRLLTLRDWLVRWLSYAAQWQTSDINEIESSEKTGTFFPDILLGLLGFRVWAASHWLYWLDITPGCCLPNNLLCGSISTAFTTSSLNYLIYFTLAVPSVKASSRATLCTFSSFAHLISGLPGARRHRRNRPALVFKLGYSVGSIDFGGG